MSNKELIERSNQWVLANKHYGWNREAEKLAESLVSSAIKALQDAEGKILARDEELDSLQKLLYVKNEEINRLKAELEDEARQHNLQQILNQELKAKLSEQVDADELLLWLSDSIEDDEIRSHVALGNSNLILEQFKKEL